MRSTTFKSPKNSSSRKYLDLHIYMQISLFIFKNKNSKDGHKIITSLVP